MMNIRVRILKEGAKRQYQRSDSDPRCSCPRYDIYSHRGRGSQLPGTKFLRLPTTRTETKRRLVSVRFRSSYPWSCFRCNSHPVHDCCQCRSGGHDQIEDLVYGRESRVYREGAKLKPIIGNWGRDASPAGWISGSARSTTDAAILWIGCH